MFFYFRTICCIFVPEVGQICMPFTSNTLSLSPLKQAIERDPLILSHSQTVTEVIQQMDQRRSDYALILEGQTLVGIFTTRDITRLVASEIDIAAQPIAQLMTRQVVSLRLTALETIWSALSILSQYHIRHLPLLDEQQQIVGIITPYSIRAALQPIDLLKLRRIAEVMVTEVICVAPEASLLHASRLMMVHRISCIVIAAESATERSTPLGILTERDIVRLRSLNVNFATTLVPECMSQPLRTVTPDDSLWNAHQIMKEHQIRRMVVVDRMGHLMGLISQANLLKVIDPLELPDTIAALEEIVTQYTNDLQQNNQRLQTEVLRREQAEAALQGINERLEALVAQRAIALSQIETQYRSLVENLPDGIARFDRDKRFIYVNAATARMVGLPPEEFLGKTHSEIEQIPPATTASCQQAIQQVFATATEVVRELEYQSPDGSIYQVDVRLVPELNSRDNVETVLAIARDITPLKQIEVDTRRLLAREQELSALTTMFISTVSHEFRTPLTVITTGIELLKNYRERYDNAQTQERLDRIQTATQCITHLMNDLSTISDLMSGHYELNPTRTDVVALVAELVQRYQQNLPPQLTINFTDSETDDAPLTCTLDANLLRIILVNILSNAIKFSPQGGRIIFNLTLTAIELVFQLVDPGIGIPSTELPYLFQPFFRASNAQTIRGSGIGLAIVEYCIDYLQAALSIESEVDRGTTVTLRLGVRSEE